MDEHLVVMFSLLVAYVLDLLLGDPHWLPHPIVFFGKGISFFDKKLNKGKGKKIKGFISVFFLVSLTFVLFYLLKIAALYTNFWLYILYHTIFLFFGIANKTLIKEGKMVFKALAEKGVEAGRMQIARLVGRDTKNLSKQEIKIATLETLSENLSDGVVAPLFFYAIGGIPALMTYKMINTLDSMIGYKNKKYKEFGFFAAKLDDVANYIPARLTSFLMALLSFSSRAFVFVFKYGHLHSSPNAGYPEAALAGILNCRFGGANLYFGKKINKPYIGTNNKIITQKDIKTTLRINHIVCLFSVLLVCLKIYLLK